MKFPRPFSNLLESFKSRWHSFNVLRKSPQIWRRDFKSRLRPSRDNEAGTCLVTSPITSPSFVRFVAKCWISAPNSAYCFAEQDHSELVRVLLATMGITVDAVPCLIGRELPKNRGGIQTCVLCFGKAHVPQQPGYFTELDDISCTDERHDENERQV